SADDRDQLAMPCKAIQLGPAGVLVDVFVETNVVGPHSATKRIRGHNGSAHQRLLPSTAHPVHGSIILSYIICDMNIPQRRCDVGAPLSLGSISQSLDRER